MISKFNAAVANVFNKPSVDNGAVIQKKKEAEGNTSNVKNFGEDKIVWSKKMDALKNDGGKPEANEKPWAKSKLDKPEFDKPEAEKGFEKPKFDKGDLDKPELDKPELDEQDDDAVIAKKEAAAKEELVKQLPDEGDDELDAHDDVPQAD